MRIQQLPSSIANQIAAGEVIERPASVVKELLENALDALATHIHVDIGFGGLNQIRVSDNGIGICADDMYLAIAAHATSKITQLTDLYQITTMGFRGEALASIASVSRLTLHSKPMDQAHGMMLSVDESGATLRSCPRTQGTTVDVRDLFFNAPVRKTFLKTERAEYQAIELVVKQFALSVPSVGLTLNHNNKLILHLAPGQSEASRLRRVKKLFGQAFLADAVYVEETHEFLQIIGWVSQRAYQRSQRDRQWTYLNQRFIKDKLIQQAVGQAYQSILYPGRYASCLLYLSMAPEQVDVNVHPTKHEVRFRDPRLVHAMIVSTITKQLQASQPLPFSESKVPMPVTDGVQRIASSLTSNATWCVINSQFIMLPLFNNGMHLINMHGLYQVYLGEQLQSSAWPLEPRSLLVPVRCKVYNHARLEQNQGLLAQFGVQFDFSSLTSLVIRTLPRCLPMLNIDQFFSVIQQEDIGDRATLIQRGIACQSFDMYNIDANEAEGLLAYCHAHGAYSPQVRTYCVPLDIAFCQKVMHINYELECV